jgi:hypothetical protein
MKKAKNMTPVLALPKARCDVAVDSRGYKQKLVWIGSWRNRDGAVTLPMADPVQLAEHPTNVWTLYQHTDEKAPPKLPFKPIHRVNAFVEDEMHDWTWRGGRFYYRSRVMDRPVWVLVEYETL